MKVIARVLSYRQSPFRGLANAIYWRYFTLLIKIFPMRKKSISRANFFEIFKQ